MRLTKIIIKNFQSFGPEGETCYFENFTIFIGRNNSGKTAMLKAIQKVFGQTQSARQIYKSDFHIPN